MKIGLYTDSLQDLSFTEALDFAAASGLEAVELGTGNFSNAPHLNVDQVLDEPGAAEALLAAVAYVIGSVILNLTSGGRTVLAIGGGEDATRLMGLRADRVKFVVYLASGGLAGLAGVILASQFGAGQPTEGVGWELFAIASVVVGGTLLTGGSGSVVTKNVPDDALAIARGEQTVKAGWAKRLRALKSLGKKKEKKPKK